MSPTSSRNSVPPSASSNLPMRCDIAPVNEPFSCPNSSLSMRSSGMAAQLTSTKGSLGAIRKLVELPGDELLSRSVLSHDEHPRVGRSDARYRFHDGEHLGVGADDIRLDADLPLQLDVLARELGLIDAVADRQQQPLHIDRLLQKIERPELRRVDRGGDRSVPRYDDDGKTGMKLLELSENLETVHTRHLDVEQHDVDALARGEIQGGRAVRRGEGLELLVREQPLERAPDTLFVVDDQNPFAHFDAPPVSTLPQRRSRAVTMNVIDPEAPDERVDQDEPRRKKPDSLRIEREAALPPRAVQPREASRHERELLARDRGAFPRSRSSIPACAGEASRGSRPCRRS